MSTASAAGPAPEAVPRKVRHQCERCGLEAVLERAGRFRDEDFYELLQDYFALERILGKEQAMRHLAESRLAMARSRIDQLRELVNTLPDPVPEIDFVDEEACPF